MKVWKLAIFSYIKLGKKNQNPMLIIIFKMFFFFKWRYDLRIWDFPYPDGLTS